MSTYVFSAPAIPSVPIRAEEDSYPVNRIFCVGRNYAAHAAEMGNEVDREAPFYFTKSPAALVESGAEIPFPPQTNDLHHEMEFVVAIGKPAFRVGKHEALEHVFGYACGLDMTRRDLQAVAKEKRRSWDVGKDFENSAVIAPITRAADFGEPAEQRISLEVSGELRQDASLSDMIWSVEEIISDLSRFYHLEPGDLIMTGTPAGVGRVEPSDKISGNIDGLAPVSLVLGKPAD